MGGRGASSGTSKSGKLYGSEYKTLYQSGNIKFVSTKSGSTTAPLETMTKGRIYVTVNQHNELKCISYYDKNNKRYKQIDLTSPHMINGKMTVPHKHLGYLHNEKGDYELSEKDNKMVERVTKIWYNKRNKIK